MERRDFLKLASLAGLGVAVGSLPYSHEASAEGAGEPYTGPFWVMVHCGGGWDVTSLCDPKGFDSPTTPFLDQMNHYPSAAIEPVPGSASGMKYAPEAPNNNQDFGMGGTDIDPNGPNATFFKKYYKQLLILNGINCATNSHDVGTRVNWSGSLTENRPSFAALVAGAYGKDKPMAWVVNGGYDVANGVVAVTRTGNIGAIQDIAYPELFDPNNLDRPFHADEVAKRMLEARNERQAAMLARQRLPRIQKSMGTLFTARTGQNELKKLKVELDKLTAANNGQLEQGLRGQVQIALAAYKAGICIAANVSPPAGFDTHGNNDAGQFNGRRLMLDGVDYLMEQAGALGIKVRVLVSSDFGRTPAYNMGNGKDHWAITSMMLMGDGIKGDRVIGGTDPGHNALKIDPVTLALSDGGIQLKPGHIHRALRKLAGIDTNPIVQNFSIKEEEDLPLFPAT
jgi:hypothetical protein